MGYIYKITNQINNKIYIGQTRYSLNHRFSQHKNNKLDYDLYKDIKEYGIDNFIIEPIEICENNLLNEREKYWIKYYDSYENGYNMTRGGAGHYLGKKIYCFTLKGNLYKIYNDIFEASKDLNIKVENIEVALTSNNLSSSGFQWCYENNLNKIQDLSNLKQNYGKIKVLTLQYSLDGKFINKFNTMLEAQEKTGIQSSGIARCINGEIKHSGGYQWIRGFLGEPIKEKINSIEVSTSKGKKRQVICLNNNIIYNSILEASQKTGVSRNAITNSCNKNGSEAKKGLKFKYYEK